MLTPVFFAIYYVAKSIFMNIKISREYLNNLSDVKEIVKDDENSSYLDEESTKLIKEINALEEAKKEEKRIIKEAKKKQKQEIENKKINSEKSGQNKNKNQSNTNSKPKKATTKKSTQKSKKKE